MFLVCNPHGEEVLNAEVLSYDAITDRLHLLAVDGIETHPKKKDLMQYGRGFRLLTLEDDYAEFAKLCPRHPAGEAHREEAG